MRAANHVRAALAAGLLVLPWPGAALAKDVPYAQGMLGAIPHQPVTAGQPPASLVADQRPMSGLAAFYNHVGYYRFDGSWHALAAGDPLDRNCMVAAVGRYRTLVVDLARAGRGAVTVDADGSFRLAPEAAGAAGVVDARDLRGALGGLRYPHLWWPLRPIAWAMEALLVGLQWASGASWGVAILLLALALRLILLPVTRFTARAQRRVAEQEALLAPRIAAIRKEQRGEEAHMATLAAYKDLGISPYFRMRPLLAALIQVPLLVAIFNVLGELPQLAGARFLWVADLSLPDSIGRLPFALPMLGSEISLLPLLMTGCAFVAGYAYRSPGATPAALRSQQRNTYLLAIVFLLLFYPFPAGMVWFWFATNLLQLGQQLAGRARNG